MELVCSLKSSSATFLHPLSILRKSFDGLPHRQTAGHQTTSTDSEDGLSYALNQLHIIDFRAMRYQEKIIFIHVTELRSIRDFG